MKKVAGPGRPSLRRDKAAGRNLRTALKLLGKTWRKDVGNPNHVHNWVNWSDCGLPSSATTIDGDMRLGVPEKRVAAYALCLGVAPETLCSARADMVGLLGASSTSSGRRVPFVSPGYGDSFPGRYLKHNRPSYIQELFALTNGVYRMDYLLQGVDLIHRCTLWVYGVEAHRLLVRGRFVMFGNENLSEGSLFRWHNNLHIHYLCENGLELGYLMTIDPLRHNIVRRRDPFWLGGTGMTDRGLADNQPVTLVFHAGRLLPPEGASPEDLWRLECADMRARPFIAPADPDYERVRTEILTPEELTTGEPA